MHLHQALLSALGHVYHNLAGDYPKPIKIRQPYSNVRCLSCHGGAQNFLAKHEKEQISSLLSNKDSCSKRKRPTLSRGSGVTTVDHSLAGTGRNGREARTRQHRANRRLGLRTCRRARRRGKGRPCREDRKRERCHQERSTE